MMKIENHPRGLKPLFLTELWERFAFFTLQTIIILYMTKSLSLPDDRAFLLYGTFSSMLYLTPVLGGYLADRYLGYQRSIIIGGALLMVGYLIAAAPSYHFFFLGLSVVIIANGLFKPNISSILGGLYRPNDYRRESGFTLFYMGINIGALIPPLITGSLVNAYGWHVGFLLAALAMGVGLAVFVLGKGRFRLCGNLPPMSPLHYRAEALTFYTLFCAGVVAAVAFMVFLFRFPGETDILLALASLVTIGIVIYLMLKEKKAQRNKMIACLVLIVISVGFWALYNQTFMTLMLYADRSVNKELFGFNIDAEFTRFFNPFFILLLSPFLSRLWLYLSRRQINPSTPTKFSLGILFMALGFFLLGLGGEHFSHEGETSLFWLAGSYLLQTIGELLLAPIGLAMISTLSPKHLVSMMKGVWFLTQSAAFAIGGGLATLASAHASVSNENLLQIYDNAFFIYGAIAFALFLLSFSLIPNLNRLIMKQ